MALTLNIPLMLLLVLLLHLFVAQYGHGLPHSDQSKFLVKHLIMADHSSSGQDCQIDPGVTLSNVDLLKLLMNDSSTKVAELWKDVRNELDLDRNHNKEVNKQIIEGLGKRIDILEKYVIANVDDQVHNALHISKEKQSNFSCYLCVQSFHTLSSLDEHIVSNHASLICEECGKTL